MCSAVQELHPADTVASSSSSGCWFDSLELWAHLWYLVCLMLIDYLCRYKARSGKTSTSPGDLMILIHRQHAVVLLRTFFVVPDTVWACELGTAEGTSKTKGWPKLAQNLTVHGEMGLAGGGLQYTYRYQTTCSSYHIHWLLHQNCPGCHLHM